MATVDDVLDALNDQINDAIIAAGITNEGIIAPGFPNMPDLTKQMEQVPAQYFVSLFPLPTEKLTTRFLNEPWGYLSTVNVPLTATVSGNVITFGGSVVAGLNIHTVIGAPTVDAYYQTVAGESLDTVAANVAAKVNALGVSGLSATASGPAVTISGGFDQAQFGFSEFGQNPVGIICNIGGSVTVGYEVMRTERHFQISVWCPDAPTRSAIFNAIKVYLAQVYFLSFPDTSQGRLKYVSSPWNDDMQQDTLYFLKAIYSVEWGEIAQETQTQIGAVQITTTTTANGEEQPAVTITEG